MLCMTCFDDFLLRKMYSSLWLTIFFSLWRLFRFSQVSLLQNSNHHFLFLYFDIAVYALVCTVHHNCNSFESKTDVFRQTNCLMSSQNFKTFSSFSFLPIFSMESSYLDENCSISEKINKGGFDKNCVDH